MQSAVKMSWPVKIVGHLLVWLCALAMGGLMFGMLRLLALREDELLDALPYIVCAGGAYGLYVGRAARRYQAPAWEAASMGLYMGAVALIVASPMCLVTQCQWGIPSTIFTLATAFGATLAVSSWLGYVIWSTCVVAVYPWATLPPKPSAPHEASHEASHEPPHEDLGESFGEAPAPDEPER